MNYQEVVDLIRDVAGDTNPNGNFVHGMRVDGSLEYSGKFPLILLEPFVVNINTVTDIDTINISLGFLFQDGPASSPEEREAIISNADTLCMAYLRELETRSVDIENARATPFYRVFQGVLSGYLLTFNLITKRTRC